VHIFSYAIRFLLSTRRVGWIEFADKKIAKQVAESLNNTAIGGKKGDFYHDDIWNLKYLKKFK
jgi:ESF2/ABP1 family protein